MPTGLYCHFENIIDDRDFLNGKGRFIHTNTYPSLGHSTGYPPAKPTSYPYVDADFADCDAMTKPGKYSKWIYIIL